jgi:hypothetical protein
MTPVDGGGLAVVRGEQQQRLPRSSHQGMGNRLHSSQDKKEHSTRLSHKVLLFYCVGVSSHQPVPWMVLM